MIQAACPNCGNSVPFQSEFSTHAVCAFCDTLMVRQGSGVENLGKVAELQPDGSPLQVGAAGQYGGKSFQIIGRIQLSYPDGFWNEWHLMYSNGETGWLGEAMGEYFVSFAKDACGLPGERQIGLGDSLALDGESYVVTGSTVNRLSSYEGEIPFLVDTQGDFTAFDLRSATGKAATIDYSDEPPTLFLGEYKPFSSFSFSGLRQQGEPPDQSSGVRVQAQSAGVENFNCPTCGAPHSVQGGVRSKLLVCEYCGSAVDITTSSLNVVWQEERLRRELEGAADIPLGSVGRFDEKEFTVIGYVKKSVTVEGVKYPWIEYLLYNFHEGYRWLVESDGHYTLVTTMDGVPRFSNGAPVGRPGRDKILYEGREYLHFQTSTAYVDAVAGEFYWRVKVGDQATNFDYICPPYSLSMEASESGFVWSKGEYVKPSEVASRFGLGQELRSPVGIAPSQPNPHLRAAKEAWRVFTFCAVAGFLLLLTGLLSGSTGTLFQTKSETFNTFRENPVQRSQPFEVKGHGNVAVDFTAHPSERWMYLEARLKNQKTNQTYTFAATLESFYGKSSTHKVIRSDDVPNGNYVMEWEVKSGTDKPVPDKVDLKQPTTSIPYSIKVVRGVRVWGWWYLMILLLLPLPVMLTAKKSRFETGRWYNSDYG